MYWDVVPKIKKDNSNENVKKWILKNLSADICDLQNLVISGILKKNELIEQKDEELKKLRVIISNLNKVNKSIVNKSDKLKERVKNVEKEKENLIQQFKQNSDKAVQRQDEIAADYKSIISQLELEKTNIQSLLKEKIKNISRLEEEGPHLRSSLGEKDLILKDRQTEIDSLKSSVNMKTSMINEYEKNIDNLKIELNNQEKKFQIHDENTSKLEKKVEILEGQKTKLDETIESLLSRIKTLEESHKVEQEYWLKDIKENKDMAKKLTKKALIYKQKLKDISEATVNIEKIYSLEPKINEAKEDSRNVKKDNTYYPEKRFRDGESDNGEKEVEIKLNTNVEDVDFFHGSGNEGEGKTFIDLNGEESSLKVEMKRHKLDNSKSIYLNETCHKEKTIRTIRFIDKIEVKKQAVFEPLGCHEDQRQESRKQYRSRSRYSEERGSYERRSRSRSRSRSSYENWNRVRSLYRKRSRTRRR